MIPQLIPDLSIRRTVVLLAVIALVLLSPGIAVHAQQSPTVTIVNQSSQFVLAKLRGPSSGTLSIGAGARETANVSGGNYFAFFRYGDGRRYSYTKVGPFAVVETSTEVSEITIVLHTVSGNANEEPSNENEFDRQ